MAEPASVSETTPITLPNLLLVEGQDERRFFQAMLPRWGRPDLQVLDVGGRDRFAQQFPAVRLAPGFDAIRWLGIAQDADNDPDGAFRRVCGVLRQASLPIPAQPWQAQPAPDSGLTVVALIWPDGTASGDLEQLLWSTLADQPAAACVEDYLQCLKNSADGVPRQTYKARIHAFLASLQRPDLRLGEAAERGVLPLTIDHPVLARLLALLPAP